LNDQNDSVMLIVMQRCHADDLGGHVLEHGGWTLLKLPTEYDPGRSCITVKLPESMSRKWRDRGLKDEEPWHDPRTKQGQLLNPKRFDDKANERAKRTLGGYGYSAQHDQEPSPREGGMFKRWWWAYWQPPGANLPPVPVRQKNGSIVQVHAFDLPTVFDKMIQSWDMTFKKLEDGSFVCGGVLAKLGAFTYLLHMVHEHLSFTETCKAVESMSEQWPEAGKKLVESAANGPAVVQSLRNKIAGFDEVASDGSKEARASAVSPFCESGNVVLPHPLVHRWTYMVIDETANFPRSKKNDIVDMLSQGLRHLYLPIKRKKVGVWGRS
jgi:predicted phage terminase large subunit-like protein